MKFYLLERIGECDYDEADGFVVRARSPFGARRLAAGYAIGESDGMWLDPTLTTCQVLSADGEPRVILRDYLHA